MILLSTVLTNLIMVIVAMQGVSPKCRNINEYSTAGKVARTKSPVCSEYHRDQKSALTIVPRGQLGNHLYSYSLLVSLQQHYKNLNFYLSSGTWNYITKYFDSSKLLLPSINELCFCKSSYGGVYSEPLKWKFWNTEHGIDFVRDLSRLENHQGNGTIWVLWSDKGFPYTEDQFGVQLLEQHNRLILDSLNIKSNFLRRATKKIKSSVRKWFSQNKKKVKRLGLHHSNLTIVGIHHRRGDHLQYEKAYKIPHITMGYIGPSMDLFRNMFNNTVMFIYVSDDKEWIKNNMKRDKDVIVGSSDSTGDDLALLSLCHHTIMTRGTFSTWAAMLAGGLYIRPSMFIQSSSQKEIERKMAKDGGNTKWPHNPLEKRWQKCLWKE